MPGLERPSDMTAPLNSAVRSGTDPSTMKGLRANDVYRTADGQGRVAYSGYGDGSGATGDLVNGDGSKRSLRGGFNVVPAGSMSGSGQTNPAVSAALSAAAARGDFDAVRGYYQRDGGTFNGQTAEQSGGDANAPQLGQAGYRTYNLIKNAQDQNKIALRGHEMNYDVGMMGNKAKRAQLNYEIGKDQRDYDETHAKNMFDQKQASEKSWNDQITQAHNVNGTVDQAAANATLNGMNEMIARQIQDLERSGTPGDMTRAQNLKTHGIHAVDPATRQKVIAAVKLMNKVKASSSNINPFVPGYVGSSDPRDFMDLKRTQSGEWATKP